MQTIQTIIGPKTSRTRDFDGAFQNDGKISECDQGRASIKQDVSKNIIKKKIKGSFIDYLILSCLLFCILLIYFIAMTAKNDRSSI